MILKLKSKQNKGHLNNYNEIYNFKARSLTEPNLRLAIVVVYCEISDCEILQPKRQQSISRFFVS